MDLRQCYEMMGGSYDNIIRILMTENRIIKYLNKFEEDKTMGELTASIEKQDYEVAFRCAHTLKGISLNLGMTQLAKSASELTEALRSGETQVDELYAQVTDDYKVVIDAIHALDD